MANLETAILIGLQLSEGKSPAERAAMIAKAIESIQVPAPPPVTVVRENKLVPPPIPSWQEPVQDTPLTTTMAAPEPTSVGDGGNGAPASNMVVIASEMDLDAELQNLSLRKPVAPRAPQAAVSAEDGQGQKVYWRVEALAKHVEANTPPYFDVTSGDEPVRFIRGVLPLPAELHVRLQYRCLNPPAGLKTFQAAVGKPGEQNVKGGICADAGTYVPSAQPLEVKDSVSAYDQSPDLKGTVQELMSQATFLLQPKSGQVRTVPVPVTSKRIEDAVGVKLGPDELDQAYEKTGSWNHSV